MAKIQIKRGQQSNVQNLVLAPGELAVALDTGNVYIGTDTGKVHINPTGGTADEAVKLTTPRVFRVIGDATAPDVYFDGTGNVELVLSLSELPGLTPGDYAGFTIDNTGRVTGARTLIADDIPQLSATKISGLGTAAAKDTGTASGNIPVLGADGKLDTSVIPAIALSDIFTVENETEMLALEAQTGDVAIRTDENKTYILSAEPASEQSNWRQLLTPAAPVQSVNGKTGIVTLTADDVGATDEKVKVTNLTLPEMQDLGTDEFAIPFTNESSTYTGELKMKPNTLKLVGSNILSVGDGNGIIRATTFEGTANTAKKANKLSNPRAISLSGGVTGPATNFDGTSDITISVTALEPAALSESVPVTKGGTGATTAAEALVNLGFSATAQEMNCCQGVTSNIQEQLNTVRDRDIDGGVF